MKEVPFDFDKNLDSEGEYGTLVFVPEKVKQVETAYKIMQLIAKGKDLNVTYELNTPYVSMGAVSVVGKEIVIADQALFVKVAEMASNFEIYPKTDGTVQMNFTFHNLTRRVEE